MLVYCRRFAGGTKADKAGVMRLRMAVDTLKLLFFPGILFMAACGMAALFLEGSLARVVGGGKKGWAWRALLNRFRDASPPPAAEAVAALMPVAAMGVAGMFLVWVEGDLLSLVLMIGIAGVLPFVAVWPEDGGNAARAPLLFRASMARLLALACACVTVGMRYPGGFTAALEGFTGEGVFGAVRAWSGPAFALMLSAQVCAVAALFVFLLAHPACAVVARHAAGFSAAAAAIAEGSERAVTLLLFAVVCLGYPWKDMGGLAAWASAGLGMALVVALGRAWLEGRNEVFRRRALRAAPVLAALSLALAAAAAVYGG